MGGGVWRVCPLYHSSHSTTPATGRQGVCAHVEGVLWRRQCARRGAHVAFLRLRMLLKIKYTACYACPRHD
eukprot:scaffold28967_cov118-Isochrysis_galbana.AAC.3